MVPGFLIHKEIELKLFAFREAPCSIALPFTGLR
jgi:hypothetical protein